MEITVGETSGDGQNAAQQTDELKSLTAMPLNRESSPAPRSCWTLSRTAERVLIMNPYGSPRAQAAPTPFCSQRLDRGVLGIAVVMIIGCLASIVGMAVPTVRDFLMPRFGWIGLFISSNSLMFIGFWMKKPTRSALFAASFMTCAIAVINGAALFRTGTVDVVENVFHDRLVSAWIWSVVTYLCAGGYFAFVAFRIKSKPPQAAAH